MNNNLSISKIKTYKVKTGYIGQKPYLMAYKHYLSEEKLSGQAVIVLIAGGGHRMTVWEKIPSGRKGWATLFAESGREVIIVEWACNSPDIYKCSNQELCTLTQGENMGLIKKVIEKEVPRNRKIIFLGWSMGGPQAFKLACDILPKRTVAILGYAATGPLNCFEPISNELPFWDSARPMEISREWINRQCKNLRFTKDHRSKYVREYLVPFSPLMAAVQSKRLEVKNYWGLLTINNCRNIPPVLLINGNLDFGHRPARERFLVDWLKQYQEDITVKYVKNFTHLGMLDFHNKQLVKLYLGWLTKRNL